MPPRRRVPPLTLERPRARKLLLPRHPRAAKPAHGAEHDSGLDGAALPRRNVLEHDVVRLRVRVPRRAHHLGTAARVRAQAVPCPEVLPVRPDLALSHEVCAPVWIRRAREGVPVSWDVAPATLGLHNRARRADRRS